MSLSARAALGVCNLLNARVIVPLARWATRDKLPSLVTEGIPQYVDPDPRLNPLVLAQVLNDLEAGWVKTPEVLQAELNGCMELMKSETANRFLALVMGLLTQYPPAESYVRMMANALQLGMYLERRLKDS
jgi:hypothetical protein